MCSCIDWNQTLIKKHLVDLHIKKIQMNTILLGIIGSTNNNNFSVVLLLFAVKIPVNERS